jgi:hypothetical protein
LLIELTCGRGADDHVLTGTRILIKQQRLYRLRPLTGDGTLFIASPRSTTAS